MEHNFSPIILDRKSCIVFTGSDVRSLKQEILICLVQFTYSEVRLYITVLSVNRLRQVILLICFSIGEEITSGQYTSAMGELTSY